MQMGKTVWVAGVGLSGVPVVILRDRGPAPAPESIAALNACGAID